MRKNNLVRKLFVALFIINIVFITAAIFFYPDNFLFWPYPFSYSGDAFTMSGVANTLSMWIYRSGMILSGLVTLYLAYYLYYSRNEVKNVFKTLCCSLAGFGFLIASVNPDDTRHQYHVLGSALIVASLWILATNYLFERKENFSKLKYVILQFILQVPIFTYAIAYFLNYDINYAIQKLALAGLVIALVSATNEKNS